jgi:hypothetical protein
VGGSTAPQISSVLIDPIQLEEEGKLIVQRFEDGDDWGDLWNDHFRPPIQYIKLKSKQAMMV